MINSTDKLSKMVFFLISTVFLFWGNLISLNVFDLNIKIEYKWIVIFLFSIVLFFFVMDIKFNPKLLVRKSKFKFMLLWESFIISIFISKAVHGEFLLLECILYSIMVPTVFFSKQIQKYKNMFLAASVFSIIPFMYILGFGNSLGIIICLAGINLLNLLIIHDSKKIYIYIVLTLFSVLIFITKSRTALVSFLFVTAMIIFMTLKEGDFYFSKLIKNSLVILLFLILIYFSYDYINNLIFGKYVGSHKDIFSGRSKIWLGTLKTGIRLFGNGEEYFMYTYNIGDAHNTFIQVLGVYGLLSFTFFTIIYIYIIIKSLKFFKKIEYICFFCGFLLMGLAENLFFINSRMIFANILFFMYLGCLINEE